MNPKEGKTGAVDVEEAAASPSSLDSLFRPRGVAVVGASRDRDSLGWRILDNLMDFGFRGVVFPVNPSADVVHSVKCYPSLLDIPDPVDLAVIVVPHRFVPGVLEDCAKKGVRGVVVITAGFREVGEEGVERESQLLEQVRESGMRLIGPNCMGIINTENDVRLDATFAAYLPLAGNVSFISQSGALGEAILAACRQTGIGIHMFASVGNRADISSNDLLEYWEDDPGTGVILLYLESFGNPRRFPHLARRVSRKKPVIAVKAGGTSAGARAATSHTGALAAVKDVTIDSLFEQTGILRARTLEEMLRMAHTFASQPLPEGPRVGIVTNAGGPGILATDACVHCGLQVPELAADTRSRLRKLLPAEASVANPVDLIATASPAAFQEAIRIVAEDPGIDALLIIAVCLLTTDDVALAQALVEGTSGAEMPVLTCFMGKSLSPDGKNIVREAGIPAFDFPEAAAQSLASMDRYRRFRSRPRGDLPDYTVDRQAAKRALKESSDKGLRELGALDLEPILQAYGIPVVPGKMVSNLEEALAAARELGFPVVLKFLEEGATHKTESGAVRLDLESVEDLVEAWEDGRSRFPTARVQIQKMLRGGQEVILGMAQDPVFGPLLMVGLGGITVEAVGDVVFRVHPLTDTEPKEMIEALRGVRLLRGFRGRPPVDEAFLEECILRLSQLVGDFPELVEFEINPFVIGGEPSTSAAVDVRARLRDNG